VAERQEDGIVGARGIVRTGEELRLPRLESLLFREVSMFGRRFLLPSKELSVLLYQRV